MCAYDMIGKLISKLIAVEIAASWLPMDFDWLATVPLANEKQCNKILC